MVNGRVVRLGWIKLEIYLYTKGSLGVTDSWEDGRE